MTGNASKHPPFGRRGCVDARKLANAAPHLQREGILLMLETGLSIFDVAAETGFGPVAAQRIADDKSLINRPDWSF